MIDALMIFPFLLDFLLAVQPQPREARILAKAKRALSRHALPPDAVLYCEARARQERVKARVGRRPPTDPALRDEIERLYTTDQAVRQTKDFDVAKMEGGSRARRAAVFAHGDRSLAERLSRGGDREVNRSRREEPG
jgi:hypothetical protein